MASTACGSCADKAKELLEMIERLQVDLSAISTSLAGYVKRRELLENQLDVTGDPLVDAKLKKAVESEQMGKALRSKILRLSAFVQKSLLKLSADPAKTQQFIEKKLAGEEVDAGDVGSWLPITHGNLPRLHDLLTKAVAYLEEIGFIADQDEDEEEEIST